MRFPAIMSPQPLIENGVAYLAAKAAASRAGISADYAYRLAKSGAVAGKRVGTAWYVNEASLTQFIARKELEKRERATRHSEILREEFRRAQCAHFNKNAISQPAQPEPALEPQHPPIETPQPPATPLTPEQQLLKNKLERARTFAAREALMRGNRPSAVALATITLLIATSAAAFSNTTIRTHIIETASQLPHYASAAATSATSSATAFKEKLPALDLLQLPALQSQLAATILPASVQSTIDRAASVIFDFFCPFFTACETFLAQSQTQHLATSQVFPEKSATTSRILRNQTSEIAYPHPATKSENVKPASASTQTAAPATTNASSATAGSASNPSPSPITHQYVTLSGITEALLNSRLLQLEADFNSRITSASLASAYQSTRASDNVGDNIRNLTDRYSNSFDTDQLSADSADFDALTVSGSGSIGGDLTVAGTITGGTLAVAGLSSGGAIAAPYFTATSSSATSTFAGRISVLGPAQFANFSNFFGETKFGATGTTTIATDGTISTPGISAQTASLTSATATSLSAQTASAASATAASLTSYNATLGSVVATSSLTLSALPNSLLATDSSGTITATTSLASSYLAAIDKGFFFATTSADYWQSQRNFFSTTSASYFLAQNQGNAFSTSSASNFLSLNQGLAFSTSSADAWKAERDFFSTTSTAYFLSVNQGSLFSTTSANYWQTTRDFFSTTSATYFAHSSTTIPKTYTANTFTALQTFSNASSTLFSASYASTTNLLTGSLAFTGLSSALLATDASGNVTATSTLASSLLSLPSGYTFRGTASNLAEATSTLFVASSGNVGVATTSPANRLDVNGSVGLTRLSSYGRSTGSNAIRVMGDQNLDQWINFRAGGATPSGAAGAIFSLFGTSHFFIHHATTTGSDGLRISYSTENTDSPAVANASTFLALTTSGNIGIGTTTPSAKLTIDTGSGGTNLSLARTSGQVNQYSFDITSTGTGVSGALNLKADWADGAIGLRAAASGNAQFVLLSSGNVGIGTTNPTAPLEIQHPSTPTLYVRANTGSVSTPAVLRLLGSNSLGSASQDVHLVAYQPTGGGNADAAFDFRVRRDGDSFGSPGTIMTLRGTGNVGIGTTSPNARLEIRGTGAGTDFRLTRDTTGNYLYLRAPGGAPTGAGIGINGSEYLTILNTSGNLGIGTTSPWKTLSVVGTAAINGLTSSATGNYVCINTTTWELTRGNGSSCTTSSQRFKENIQALDHGLEDVLAMRPVSFQYRPEMNMGDATRVGFIAEEMQQLVPEVVALDEQGRPAGIDYPSLTAVLANAIKEIASITGQFKQNLIALLADASNGITDLFAKSIHAENVHADTGSFRRLESEELCAKDTDGNLVCLTADQFAAMLSQYAGAAAPISTPPPPSNRSVPGDQNPPSADESAPQIPAQESEQPSSEIQDQSIQNPTPAADPDLTQNGDTLMNPEPLTNENSTLAPAANGASSNDEEPAVEAGSERASWDAPPPAPADSAEPSQLLTNDKPPSSEKFTDTE